MNNFFIIIKLLITTIVIISIFIYYFKLKKNNIPIVKYDSDIIKIIHQSYNTLEISKIFYKYILSWKDECYPDWKYMFWTDADKYNFINKHYNWFIKYFKVLPEGAYKTEISRYFYMYHYGGVFTDLANECLRKFDHLLNGSKFVFIAIEGQNVDSFLYGGYIQNSFMYSGIKKHPFWLYLIKEMVDKTYNRSSRNTLIDERLTILTNSIYNYFQNDYKDWSGVKIYNQTYFNPFSWISSNVNYNTCKKDGRMNYTEWQSCRKSLIKLGYYVVQYYD